MWIKLLASSLWWKWWINVSVLLLKRLSPFPVPNQKEVAKTSQIIVTFNESLTPATVTTATFTVVDGGTNPPTPIAGTLVTSRDDFDIVFTPLWVLPVMSPEPRWEWFEVDYEE